MPSNGSIIKRLQKAKVAFVDILFKYMLDKVIASTKSKLRGPYVSFEGPVEAFTYHDEPKPICTYSSQNCDLNGFSAKSLNDGYFVRNGLKNDRLHKAAGIKHKYYLLFEAFTKLVKCGITPEPLDESGNLYLCRLYYENMPHRSFFDRRSRIQLNEKGEEVVLYGNCAFFAFWAKKNNIPLEITKLIVSFVSE